MNRGAMYNCPACGENFNSKTIGIKHCPFCGAKYKDIYRFHIYIKNGKRGDSYEGRTPVLLTQRLFERYHAIDFEIEAQLDVHRVILYMNPILEKSITYPTSEPKVEISTHPEISAQLSKSRMDNINAMRDK